MTIEVNGKSYEVIDFETLKDISFFIKGEKEEVIKIFEDVDTIKVGEVIYNNLKFSAAYLAVKNGEDYIGVILHVKTEEELDIEKLNKNMTDSFDIDAIYHKDEYCMYEGNLYKFVQNMGKGILPTNKTYWTVCNIATELNTLTKMIKEK